MPRVTGSRRRARTTAGSYFRERTAAANPRARSVARPGLAWPSPATVLTIVGIALAAALIFVSLVVSRGVERAIERSVEVTLGRADFRLSAPDGGTLSEDMLVRIRSVLGVAVAPAVEQAATLLPEDETVAPSTAPVTILGIDPIVDGHVRDLDLAAGETLTRRDEAAAIITERLAATEGYGLGSDVIVATPGEPERFRVVGITAGDGPLPDPDGRTVILPIEAVTRMFGLDGVARVDLLVEEGVPVAGVATELGEVLAGEPYALTTPADLADSLRLPAAGLAATAMGLGAVGALVGGLVVFGAVRLIARHGEETQAGDRAREAAVHGAIGSGIGAVAALLLAIVTASDVTPAALGPGAMAAAILLAVLIAVAAARVPPQPVGLTPARRIVATIAVVIGLFVAVAAVGTQAQGADATAPAPVLTRVVAQIDALWLLSLVIAAVAIPGAFVTGQIERLAPREAAILGVAGAVVGAVAGLAVAGALTLLGGGGVDPVAGVPWPALVLSLVLGAGLSMAAAAIPAGLAGRFSDVRTVRPG